MKKYIDNITVLVKGKLLVQHDDFWGNRNIVNVIRVGEIFPQELADLFMLSSTVRKIGICLSDKLKVFYASLFYFGWNLLTKNEHKESYPHIVIFSLHRFQ